MSLPVEAHRVKVSEDLMNPGDFVVIPKRAPKITIERIPLSPPAGRFQRLLWNLFGKKYEMKQIVEMVWPEYDAVILNCPNCNSPVATTSKHAIVSLDPLTIETPVTCPYCRTVTFTVAEGNIMTA